MSVLKILYHNLISYRFISFLIIINIIVSAFVICFSYGIYQNYNVVIEDGESAQRELVIYPTSYSGPEKTSVTTKMLIDTLKSLSDDTLDNIKTIDCDAIVPTSAIDKNVFHFYFTLDKGRFLPVGEGAVFTDSEYDSFRKIAVINPKLRTEDAENLSIIVADIGEEWSGKNIGDSEYVEIGGERFEIIDDTYKDGAMTAPITAFYNDTPLRLRNSNWCVLIEFNADISRSQYDDIVNAVKTNMENNAEIPDMDISPATELFYYRTILIVSVIISVLASLNFAVLYRFILQKRIKTLTIFRICGCTKGKVVRMYLCECMLVGLPLFALTELAFAKIVLPHLSDIFEYISYAYSPVLYLAIFGIYAVSSFIVLLIMICSYIGKHSIRELKAGEV